MRASPNACSALGCGYEFDPSCPLTSEDFASGTTSGGREERSFSGGSGVVFGMYSPCFIGFRKDRADLADEKGEVRFLLREAETTGADPYC
jgi:hypothetical protein